MGIVRSIFSRNGSDKGAAVEPAVLAAITSEPAVTKLMMLMPDASGIASYQLHSFATAKEAEAYLTSTLRGEVQEGTIMFWALTSLPPDYGSRDFEAEPVVLLRDRKRAGLVYTFSFVELDSAYDFVRHEIKGGLALAESIIFWAVPARATANHWGEITVTPSSPPSVKPAPLAAPGHDEPNGTRLHIDEPAMTAEPEAADKPETPDWPETIAEPEAADRPAHKAIEATDISNVIDILKARGLRAPSSTPQPIDEPEAQEATGDTDVGSAATANGDVDADETLHIDLSDVFGGRRSPETLTTLEDFRRRRESGEANGVNAADGLIEAPAETVSGVVGAWLNIVAAIDEAIDAHVARQVGITMTWRRLTRAFASAANVRMLVTWRGIAKALHAGAAIQAAHENALSEVWRNAARACYQAAESKSGRRGKRLAWANICWTLEEAVFAARLSQKRAASRAWANATSGVAVAAIKADAIARGLRTAWIRAAVGALNAAEAQEAHRAGLVLAWTSIGKALSDAVEAMYRHERITFAWESTSLALNEYVSKKLHHDGLVAAWTRLAAAIEEAAEATARRNGLVRAWRLLAIHTLVAADLQVRHEAAVEAWTNTSEALSAGAAAKVRFDGLVAAWQAACKALRDFAAAQMRHNGMISAWRLLALSIADGARASLRWKALIRAWRNLARACLDASKAHAARQLGYQRSWLRLTKAFGEAVTARRRRDAAIANWDAVTGAIAEAVDARLYHERCVSTWDAIATAIADALPVKRRELGAIRAWSSAMLALSEATVAEAQVRIAQAGLDREAMKSIKAAIRKARGRERAPKVAVGSNAPAPKNVNPDSARGSTDVKTKTKTRKAAMKARAANAARVTPKAAAGEPPVAQEVTRDGLTADQQAAVMDTWRSRSAGRFGEKKDPFKSFDSPPGRF